MADLDLAAALEVLTERIADRVVARLRHPHDLVDQRTSPLGSRRHCDAVRRRIADGDSGATCVGRNYYLTRDALAAELQRTGRAVTRSPAASADADALRELGLRRTR